jgi:hypothetical protein
MVVQKRAFFIKVNVTFVIQFRGEIGINFLHEQGIPQNVEKPRVAVIVRRKNRAFLRADGMVQRNVREMEDFESVALKTVAEFVIHFVDKKRFVKSSGFFKCAQTDDVSGADAVRNESVGIFLFAPKNFPFDDSFHAFD